MNKLAALLFFASFVVLAFLLAFKTGYLYILSPQYPINTQKLTGDFNKGESVAVFNNQTVFAPNFIAQQEIIKNVLGQSSGPKRIEVDLTNQRLYAYEGDRQIYNFLVSTGKWGKTPTGVFHIWVKLRYVKMEGGSQALHTYYYLPNVPFTMFFYNNEIPKWRGFGIHGTYWHDNFGHPMSHGCINMKTEEAELLYQWAQPDLPAGKTSIYASDNNPGTEVIIYGTAPNT